MYKNLSLLFLVGGLILGVLTPASAKEFNLEDATILKINAAFDDGSLTSEKLVSLYLERISAYDKTGPRINALINVNPEALSVARALDIERRAKGPRSPLHGIPVILKDAFNTRDLPTTGSSLSLKDLRPAREAYVVKRLRDAGAIILAKSNLTEMIRSSLNPSLGGRTLNPYDLSRSPGESSSGTGAALAANFSPIGTGTDNGQSVRSPASACGLFGLKPTVGVVSTAGVMPSSLTQNACGPLARSVADLASLLDVMAGFDPDDFMTRLALGKIPKSYTAFLNPEALKGARLGVVVEVLGDKPEHQAVNKVFHAAVARLEELGATVFPVRIPDMNAYRNQGTDLFEAHALMQKWFAELGPDAPFHSVEEFLEKATYNQEIVPRMLEQKKYSAPEYRDEYERRLLKMHEFRALIVGLMDRYALDGLVYPLQMKLVAQHADKNTDRNGFLASIAMLPAIDVPAGYSDPSETAPNGVPVGMDFLGRPFDEGKLISLAHAWEIHGWKKIKPPYTP